MSESRVLVRELLDTMAQTIDELLALDDADLDHACSHGCAQGGGVRRLLVHNAEHDRMHAGSISNARSQARQLQQSELAQLLRDWLPERVELARAGDGVARRGARSAGEGRRVERAGARGARAVLGAGQHRGCRARGGGGGLLKLAVSPPNPRGRVAVTHWHE